MLARCGLVAPGVHLAVRPACCFFELSFTLEVFSLSATEGVGAVPAHPGDGLPWGREVRVARPIFGAVSGSDAGAIGGVGHFCCVDVKSIEPDALLGCGPDVAARRLTRLVAVVRVFLDAS